MALVATWGVSQARASFFDYNISGSTTYFLTGIEVKVDGNSESGFYCGGIQIGPSTASGANGTVPGYANFTTVCVDLEGRIYTGQNYTFDKVAFSGQTGLNPQWGTPATSTTAAYQGIENAAWLFAHHNTVTTAKDWAALQLAVWDVIYNTDATGKVTGSRFSVTTDVDSAWDLAQTWVGSLPRTTDYVGYLLKPTDTTAQELFIGVTPVPEPTTIIAGALLLLPFGASTLRALRRNRAA
jgi:hypothetical protein